MQEEFLTYQRFIKKEDAVELAELFATHSIQAEIENASIYFDPSYVKNEINYEFRVKLRSVDFAKADALLLDISKQQIDNVEKDYHLFSFSNDELMEIVTRNDEWSKFDYTLALKILKDRGLEVNEHLLESLQKQRLKDLAKQDDDQSTWVIFGYIMAFLGGLIGVFLGWHLHSHKKTLPNGDTMYSFSPRVRKHGFRIFILGIVFSVFWSILSFLVD